MLADAELGFELFLTVIAIADLATGWTHPRPIGWLITTARVLLTRLHARLPEKDTVR